jgi:hypothetical protein
MFELSRDYKRAFVLIEKGDHIVCLLDRYDWDCREAAIAKCDDLCDLVIIANDKLYLRLFDFDRETSEQFEQQCDRLNVEFFLPISDEMMVVSRDRLEESVMAVLEAKDVLCRRKRAIA